MAYGMVQDHEGNTSSMRVITLAWTLIPLFAWAYVVVSTSTLPSIPESILGVIGLVLTGKVAQKHVEVNSK